MNTYIQQIKENCISSKYTNWYISIIEKARIRSNSLTRKEVKELMGYVEAHHIWPKSFCNNEEKLDSVNLVFLTFNGTLQSWMRSGGTITPTYSWGNGATGRTNTSGGVTYSQNIIQDLQTISGTASGYLNGSYIIEAELV